MKTLYKTLTTALLSLTTLSAFATIHIVTVADFAFSPSSMTVNVGDTVRWTWVSGFHTTTSTNIPAGAVSWNQQINNASISFDYEVLAAGDYFYECSIHSNMMGSFTAVNPAALINAPGTAYIETRGNPASEFVKINYSLPFSQSLMLTIYNVLGNSVKSVFLGTQPAGEGEKLIATGDLPDGIYFFRFEGQQIRFTRKIVLQ